MMEDFKTLRKGTLPVVLRHLPSSECVEYSKENGKLDFYLPPPLCMESSETIFSYNSILIKHSHRHNHC